MQVGEELLRLYLFIHLKHPADKLNLLLFMLHKLYALVSGQCCEDNPDALNHHEVPCLAHAWRRRHAYIEIAEDAMHMCHRCYQCL